MHATLGWVDLAIEKRLANTRGVQGLGRVWRQERERESQERGKEEQAGRAEHAMTTQLQEDATKSSRKQAAPSSSKAAGAGGSIDLSGTMTGVHHGFERDPRTALWSQTRQHHHAGATPHSWQPQLQSERTSYHS